MKRLILVLFLLFTFLTLALAADIEGVYVCKGTNPRGGSYEGTVAIIKNGDAYNVTWNKALKSI